MLNILTWLPWLARFRLKGSFSVIYKVPPKASTSFGLHKVGAYKGLSFFRTPELPIELRLFDARQNLPQQGPGPIALFEQVISCQQFGRPHLIGRCFAHKLFHEIVGFQVSVARKTIEPVQIQMLFKLRQAYEAFQGGGLHPPYVLEPHVLFHQGKNLLGIIIRKAQSSEQDPPDRHPYFYVPVEANPVTGLAGRPESGWLAHIV